MIIRIMGLALPFAMFVLAAGAALAADITLDKDCSLAEAINAADEDEAVGGCQAGDGADTIRLTANVLLTRELPAVDTKLTINGFGSYFVSGNNRFRMFVVGATGDLTLRNLTLARGNPRAGGAACGGKDDADLFGGAVCNLGALRILDSRVVLNNAKKGGSIYSRGQLHINGGRFEENTATRDGGAIYLHGGSASISDSSYMDNSASVAGGALYSNDAAIEIQGSLFYGNQAAADGGVLDSNGGVIAIVSSTFASNQAADDGGAIRNYLSEIDIRASAFSGNQAADHGGAMHSVGGSARLTNSTFTDNASAFGGALSIADDDAALRHVTIHGNRASRAGGGIFICCDDEDEGGHLYLRHSIAADNEGGDCVLGASGALEDSGHNLIGDGSCGAEAASDPLLGELAYPSGGGPAYFPLLPGSPAIDAGDAFLCSATDQIGTARPQGEGCDLGAIEYAG